ncbi:hypothetical protein ACHAWF_008966, partial [Thalassiosira exigua]
PGLAGPALASAPPPQGQASARARVRAPAPAPLPLRPTPTPTPTLGTRRRGAGRQGDDIGDADTDTDTQHRLQDTRQSGVRVDRSRRLLLPAYNTPLQFEPSRIVKLRCAFFISRCPSPTMSFSRYNPGEDEPNYSSSITGVAISNKTIVLLSTIGFASLGIAMYFLILRQVSDADDEHLDPAQGRDAYGEMLDQSNVATLNRAQRRAKAKFRMKKARRAAVPGNAPGEEIGHDDGGDAGVVMGNDGGNNELAEANPSRKERQRAAKAMEREERKVYAEEARLWRENQSTKKGGDDEEKTEDLPHEERLSLEEIFPRRANEDDALSEFLFWEPLVENIRQKDCLSSGEIMAVVQSTPKMTVGEFIERLKQTGSVSIAALSDHFGITIPEALVELENVNKRHGIIGIPDAKGAFIYVSMDMIRQAVQSGNNAKRISASMEELTTSAIK